MQAESKTAGLTRCLSHIERKIDLGAPEGWTTADFDRLSEDILKSTGVRLSVTTLKRVWGRIRYDSSPTLTTLNVLARYVGHPNWPDFLADTGRDSPRVEGLHPNTRISAPFRMPWPGVRRIMLGAGVAGLLASLFTPLRQTPLSPRDFSFRSRPVTRGIPNTVVFDYDASASPTDSVFIQQSWDASRRRRVSRLGRQHTSIYYHPGYFRAKLVVGGRVVKEHDLLIRSNGWHIALLREPVPVYFSTADAIRGGSLHLPVPLIEARHIPMQPRVPVVRYRYIDDLPRLRSDRFVLETRLRNEYRTGTAACQFTRLMIHAKNRMFFIPLSARGCVSDLSLSLAGHEVSGKEADLSSFGVDFGQWVDLRCEVVNRRASIWVNGRLAYRAVIPPGAEDLVGVTYDFAGTGSVDYCRLRESGGAVVFEENFDSANL